MLQGARFESWTPCYGACCRGKFLVVALLRICGGADLAAMTGFCAQAAVRRTPVLLDGAVVWFLSRPFIF